MKVGIALPNAVRDVRPTQIPMWALAAERASLSTVASLGRFGYPGVMDTVALAAAAAVTQTIGLMSTLVVATAWPPALLAKEVAGIDGISGDRLTMGIGVGVRADDFAVDGLGLRGRGDRLDRDLHAYREVWSGSTGVVPAGTRQTPLVFGGSSQRALARMARWGVGYVGPSTPVSISARHFRDARNAWRDSGRDGKPILIALAYFALGDADAGRETVAEYYSATEELVDSVVSGVAGTAKQVTAVRDRYADIGVDEVIFCPTTDDVAEVSRLADALA